MTNQTENSLHELKKQTAFLSLDKKNQGGGVYDIKIFADKAIFAKKGNSLSGNQFGLVGMLVAKIFSSVANEEEFTVSLMEIKKIELYENTVMGKKVTSLMFWNIDPQSADYKNIYFSLSLTDETVVKAKEIFKDLITKVEYKEITK